MFGTIFRTIFSFIQTERSKEERRVERKGRGERTTKEKRRRRKEKGSKVKKEERRGGEKRRKRSKGNGVRTT